jgi:tRNA nucleotidyltransferase (CCA-adding enzyme)
MRPRELITTHTNADFDALGSALAARRLYPGAAIRLPGGVNRNVRAFISLHTDELDIPDPARIELDAVERVIVVDAAEPDRLADIAGLLERDGVEVVVFDHHAHGPDGAGVGSRVISDDGALSTTMVGILAERGLEPTATEATALALGIHEDTGSLTHLTTTVRDIEALAWCARHGASRELVAEFLRTPLSADQRELLTALMDSAEPHDVGGVPVLIASVRWSHHVAAVSTLAAKIVELTEVRALMMLVEMDGRVFVVGRSRTPALDVGAVLESLGGGGHAPAASAVVRGRNLGEVRASVLAALPTGVTAEARARDIMSVPAWFIDERVSVDDAMAECRRRQTSGVQVESAGVLVGAVAREDLDRALGHRLGHAPVRAVMTSEVATISPDATLTEIQQAIVKARGGRVAVVAVPGDGRLAAADVLGVVTRTDLLAALSRRPPDTGHEWDSDVGDALRGRAELEPLWAAVRGAVHTVDGVYLVGGAVRDLLLDAPSFDIDLAVEGDGIAFAAALADELGGRMHPHERFHTAVVIAGDLRIDVATARTEHYEYPAALPVVEHSSIRRDLHRRDFTINSMAIAVDPTSFGLLLDPFGGRGDLAAGVLRVLHNLSFIEDPTRMFRALRYETRYGFAMEPHTLDLARSTVSMGLVGEVSGARLRDELVAILTAPDCGGSLARMHELRLDRALHPALDCSPGTVELVGRIDALRAEHDPLLPAWRTRFAAIARHVAADELEPWLEWLRIRRRDARAVALAVALPPRLLAPLVAAATPADVAELLAPHPPDVALVTAALGSTAAAEYLARGASVALELDGATLLAEFGLEPSPQVGAMLAELLRRKRNGLIDGRDQELAAARLILTEDSA